MATHRARARRPTAIGAGLYDWLTTTDHKKIGILYLDQLVHLLLPRRHARARRPAASSRQPGPPVRRPTRRYNQLFTMHGTFDDLPVHHPDPGGLRRTTSCRSRSARRTWPSRGSTRCRSGCCRSAGSCSCSGFLDRRRGRGGLDELRAAVRGPTARVGGTARTCGSWPWCSSARARSSAPSTSSSRSSRCARRA